MKEIFSEWNFLTQFFNIVFENYYTTRKFKSHPFALHVKYAIETIILSFGCSGIVISQDFVFFFRTLFFLM